MILTIVFLVFYSFWGKLTNGQGARFVLEVTPQDTPAQNFTITTADIYINLFEGEVYQWGTRIFTRDNNPAEILNAFVNATNTLSPFNYRVIVATPLTGSTLPLPSVFIDNQGLEVHTVIEFNSSGLAEGVYISTYFILRRSGSTISPVLPGDWGFLNVHVQVTGLGDCSYFEAFCSGDPHCNTWDGLRHHFQGVSGGVYSYITPCCGISTVDQVPFQILLEHDVSYCHSHIEADVTCLGNIYLRTFSDDCSGNCEFCENCTSRYDNTALFVSFLDEIIVNVTGNSSLPLVADVNYTWSTPGYEYFSNRYFRWQVDDASVPAFTIYVYTEQSSTSPSLIIQYTQGVDGNPSVYFYLCTRYAEEVCGILGYPDYNNSNDLTYFVTSDGYLDVTYLPKRMVHYSSENWTNVTEWGNTYADLNLFEESLNVSCGDNLTATVPNSTCTDEVAAALEEYCTQVYENICVEDYMCDEFDARVEIEYNTTWIDECIEDTCFTQFINNVSTDLSTYEQALAFINASGSIGSCESTCDFPDFNPFGQTPAPVFSNAGGDPHYHSLDGLRFKYDGPCSYILLTNDCNDQDNQNNIDGRRNYSPFTIIAHHGRAKTRTKNIVTLKSISINIRNVEIQLTEKNDVIINNNLIQTTPFENNLVKITNESYWFSHPLKASELYSRYHIKLKTLGIDLEYSNEGTGIVAVRAIPKDLFTCGILGNHNSNYKDDFRLRDGTILTSNTREEMLQNIIKMGDDWIIHTDHEPLRCQLYPKQSYYSHSICRENFPESKKYIERICDKLVKDYSDEIHGLNIQKCFNNNKLFSVDSTRIYDDCVTEICACEEQDISKCNPSRALQLFKDTCQNNGVTHQFSPINLSQIIQSIQHSY